MANILTVNIVPTEDKGKSLKETRLIEGEIDLDFYEEKIKNYFCEDCSEKCTGCIEDDDSDSKFIEKLENELFVIFNRLTLDDKKESAELCKKIHDAVKNREIDSYDFIS